MLRFQLPLIYQFIRLVVRHFRVHGLATWRDVAKAVPEAKKPREASRPEGNDIGVKLLRHSGEATQLVRPGGA